MFICGQCGKGMGPGSPFFDMRSMTPKYWQVDQKTKKIEHYYCSPQCSLDWYQINVRNKR